MRFKKLILAIGLVLSMAIPASTEVWPTPCTPSNPINCSRGTWGQEIRDFMDNTFDLLTAKIVSFFSDVDTIHKYATFEAAVTALCPTGDSSPEKTLIIPVVTTVAANTTVCNKLTLEFTGKGSLEPAVSITVTVNGPVISAKPLADITGGAGTVTFGSQLLNMPSGNSSGDISGIVDGTIVNADINASAAIAQSKLVDIVNVDIAAGAGIVDTKLATISTAGKVRDSALEGRDSILNYADLSAAITAIGATVKTLVIPTVTASIVSNETVPSTLTLQFTGSGQLNVGSVTLPTLTSAEYGTLEFTTTTIIRTSNSWITDSYNVADATITITGSASNNVTCGVTSATALILTVDGGSCTLVVEAASAAETVNGQDPWTVTINGPLEAPLRQVFSGAGKVVFDGALSFQRSVVECYPQWFGGVAGQAFDGADAAPAIQACVDSGANRIVLTDGTWGVDSPIFIRSGTVDIEFVGTHRTASYLHPLSIDISGAGAINAMIINQENNGKLAFSNMRFHFGVVVFVGHAIFAVEDGANSQAIFSGWMRNVWVGMHQTGPFFKGALNNYYISDSTFEGNARMFEFNGPGTGDVHFKNNVVFLWREPFIDASVTTDIKNLVTISGIHAYSPQRDLLIRCDNCFDWDISDITYQVTAAGISGNSTRGLLWVKDSKNMRVSNFAITSNHPSSTGDFDTAFIINNSEITISDGLIDGGGNDHFLISGLANDITIDNVTMRNATFGSLRTTAAGTGGRVRVKNSLIEKNNRAIFHSVAVDYNLTLDNNEIMNNDWNVAAGPGSNFNSTGTVIVKNNTIGEDNATANQDFLMQFNGSGNLFVDNNTIIGSVPFFHTSSTNSIDLEGSVAWDPANLIDGAGETSPNIAVTGAVLGDFVTVSTVIDLQGITANGYVSSAGIVKVRIQNETGGAINLISSTWRTKVIRETRR